MAVTLQELLLPQIILGVYSQIKRGRGPLGNWLGFHPDRFDEDNVSLAGPNTLPEGSVRNYTYRIDNYTRVPMKARAPGTGPATVPQDPVGQNTVAISRWHEKTPLAYEFLGNLSPLIGPNSNIDAGGQAYVSRVLNKHAQRGNEAVEMMSAGMMRDSLYFIFQGDNIVPTFTAPSGSAVGFRVDFKVPAGNKSQLNMLGGGDLITVPWNNPNAPIIGDCIRVIAAYAQLSRYSMTDVWLNSLQWYNVITNTEVRNLAGSSNVPFAEYDMEEAPGMQAGPPTYAGKLRGLPTVRWHLDDDAVALETDIDPSYATVPTGSVPTTASLSKFIPDDMAIFTTEPGKDWTSLVLGGEYVVENPGMAGALRKGWYMWKEYVTQPSAVELISLLNAVPALFVPRVVAPATVSGF